MRHVLCLRHGKQYLYYQTIYSKRFNLYQKKIKKFFGRKPGNPRAARLGLSPPTRGPWVVAGSRVGPGYAHFRVLAGPSLA